MTEDDRGSPFRQIKVGPVRVDVTFVQSGLWPCRLGRFVVDREVDSEASGGSSAQDLAARLAAVVATAVDGVITIHADGTIDTVNPAVERIFGYRADELVGRNVRVLMPDQVAREHDGYLQAYVATGQRRIIGIGRTVRGRRRDGSEVALDLSISEMWVDGRRMFTGLLRDVSERERAELTLRQSVERLDAVVRTSLDPIVVIDEGGVIEMVNPATTTLFGYSEQELLGANVSLLAASPDRERHDGYLSNYLRTGVGKIIGFSREVHGQHRDGHQLDLELAIAEIPVGSGERRRFAGFLRDVGDRKRAEAAMREAVRAAEEASELKSAFLATMSHEIRTPLNAVIGMSDLLMCTPLNQRQQEFIETIRTSGGALLAVINDILDYSRFEAGQVELRPSVVDLRQCLEDTLAVLAPLARSEVDLIVDLDPGVPTHISLDEQRLRQVLLNLVGNAVKLTAAGEVEIRVEPVGPAGPDGAVPLRFAIRDTGPGIPSEFLPQLFMPFTQADIRSTRTHGGTGLGLAISQHVVQAMGGVIEVDSAIGVGSTFAFTVAARPHAAPAVSVIEPEVSLAGRRALVVDDNQANLTIMSRQLAGWGMEVEVENSGSDALTRLTYDQDFQVMIFDLNMPGMDGGELAERIRRSPVLSQIPMILLSSLSSVPARVNEVFADFHTKPVRSATLRRMVAQVMTGTTGERKFSPAPVLAVPPARRPWRILLAEDNLANQLVARQMVLTLGHEIVVVEDGLQAVEAVERRAFDVVLMDIQMPRLDGLRATQMLRESVAAERRPWVIAMTASSMPEDRQACLDAGMNAFLAKPVQLSALRAVLEDVPAPRRPVGG